MTLEEIIEPIDGAVNIFIYDPDGVVVPFMECANKATRFNLNLQEACLKYDMDPEIILNSEVVKLTGVSNEGIDIILG